MASASIPDLGRRAKAASRELAKASSAAKNDALLRGAELLVARTDDILRANTADIERAEGEGVPPTVVDRLRRVYCERVTIGLRVAVVDRQDQLGGKVRRRLR